MRIIKFRAVEVFTKKLVYGDLVHNKKVTKTGLEDRVMVGGYEVFEDTVSQITGCCDKNGEPIYENDRVMCYDPQKGRNIIGKVKYGKGLCGYGFWIIYFEDGFFKKDILSNDWTIVK